MAQIVYSRNALANLDRLYRFLVDKNPEAAARALRNIRGELALLGRHPRLGPTDPDRPETRELFVPFGVAGYVARYTIVENRVVILAIRHASEAGYSPGR